MTRAGHHRTANRRGLSVPVACAACVLAYAGLVADHVGRALGRLLAGGVLGVPEAAAEMAIGALRRIGGRP